MVSGIYEPINTLKPIADDIWVVDGPAIRFGMPWPKFSFSTRMTIVRLDDSRLFVHSPTELAASLIAEIAEIGHPHWIIGPNRIHYWWLADWAEAYPGVDAWLAPRIAENASGRLPNRFEVLNRTGAYPWDDAIATLPVTGSFMTEVVFFHRASRTLILTDLIENFESGKLGSPLMRCMCRIAGVLDPYGSMPRDMRLTFRKQKDDLKKAVETMIAWNPERVIFAHGRWFETAATEKLKRSFAWLFD